MSGGKSSGVFVKPVRGNFSQAVRDDLALIWRSRPARIREALRRCNDANGCRAFNRQEKT